jgi:DNA/RNA endonuclease G (NUC1)
MLNKRNLGDVARTNTFRLDHQLAGYLAGSDIGPVSPTEYQGSCLDRGHQVASADRTASEADNQATFMMSNVVPQSAHLNRKVWVSFERFLRNAVLEQGKEIQILSGTGGYILGKTGINFDILVHSRNYKIAVIKPATTAKVPQEDMRLIAVEMPNLTSAGTNPVSDQSQACFDSAHLGRLDPESRSPYWRDFVTDLSRIEDITGLDYSYLYEIPAMTDEEMEQMILDQYTHSIQKFNLQSVIRNTLVGFAD